MNRSSSIKDHPQVLKGAPLNIRATVLRQALFILGLSLAYSYLHSKPSGVQELIEQGVAQFDRGEYTQAAALYKEALKLEADDPVALYELSTTYMALKDFPRSLETAIHGAGLKTPYRALFYRVIGSVYDDMGNSGAALAAFDEGLEIDPKDEMLHFNKGVTLSGWDKAGALASLQRCAVLRPNFPSSHWVMGKIYAGLGRRIEAILALGRFLMLEKKSPRREEAVILLDDLLESRAEIDPKTGQTQINVDSSLDPLFGAISLGLDLALPGEMSKAMKMDPKHISFHVLFEILASKEAKTGKGFILEHYGPFFSGLDKAGFTETFCNYIYRYSEKSEAEKWLAANPKKLKEFAAWAQNYRWRSPAAIR